MDPVGCGDEQVRQDGAARPRRRSPRRAGRAPVVWGMMRTADFVFWNDISTEKGIMWMFSDLRMRCACYIDAPWRGSGGGAATTHDARRAAPLFPAAPATPACAPSRYLPSPYLLPPLQGPRPPAARGCTSKLALTPASQGARGWVCAGASAAGSCEGTLRIICRSGAHASVSRCAERSMESPSLPADCDRTPAPVPRTAHGARDASPIDCASTAVPRAAGGRG